MSTVTLPVQDLLKRSRSKSDLYDYLTKDRESLSTFGNTNLYFLLVNFFLPKYVCCTRKFMIQILISQKVAFERDQIN